MVDVDREVDGLFEDPDVAVEVSDEMGASPEALVDAGAGTREDIADVDSEGSFIPNVISWPEGTGADDFDLPLTRQRGLDADCAQIVHGEVMAGILAGDTDALYDTLGIVLAAGEDRYGTDSLRSEPGDGGEAIGV